jgi:hypothetical protein
MDFVHFVRTMQGTLRTNQLAALQTEVNDLLVIVDFAKVSLNSKSLILILNAYLLFFFSFIGLQKRFFLGFH